VTIYLYSESQGLWIFIAHNSKLLENSFLSTDNGRETPILLGPSRRTNSNHHGPNRVDVSLPLPEDGSRSSSRNVVISSYSKFRTMETSRNPVFLSVIYHRRNPLESTTCVPVASRFNNSPFCSHGVFICLL
jgi:hypothetical protein